MSELWAKVGLDLRDHPKAIAAGDAMALWTWALLHIRAHTQDGILKRTSIGASWSGRKAARHAAKLVEVGLFVEVEGGYRMANYEGHNETRDTVDARREAARVRMANNRAAKKAASEGARSQDVRANVRTTFAENTGPRSPEVPVSVSLSDLGSGSSSSEQIPDHPTGDPCPESAADGVVPHRVDAGVLLSNPPTWREECVESVALGTGRRPSDVAASWAEFVGTRADRSLPVTPEAWSAWVGRQIRFDGENTRRGPRRVVQRDPPGPKAYEVDDGDHDWEELAKQPPRVFGKGR